MTITPEIDVPKVRDQLLADLRQARSLIANGWTQGVFQEGGQYCVIGAVLVATGTPEVEYTRPWGEKPSRVAEAASTLAETLGFEGELWHQVGSIYDFNDDAATVHEDVIGLFDTTIKRLAE